MSNKAKLRGLDTLLTLRQRETDRLTSEISHQRTLQERFKNNIVRLENLYADSGYGGNFNPALSTNCGDYKQAVLQLANAQRQDLALHEKDMEITHHAFIKATRKREALSHVLAIQTNKMRREKNAIDQKRQDEIATQLWLREQE